MSGWRRRLNKLSVLAFGRSSDKNLPVILLATLTLLPTVTCPVKELVSVAMADIGLVEEA